ncbi:hypothetical protein FMEXI_10004 [Fusarium mexicanum]|uniref:Stress-response A/B barrel domain-containing protein n=1 Tax=Fusarium mexicanum TaxID=751941 RepID=A0A8H5IIT3_9HYPO|nr:hypothetical protein FMEXI_10004 [Fusarium mexicanum]
MANLVFIVPRYKIFNNKEEAIKIPASHVLKHPYFEEHFTRGSSSRTRNLETGRCSCIIDIVAVFLRDGRFYNLHTGQCRCICKSTNFLARAVAIYGFAIEFGLHALAELVADDIPKFAERMKPADALCLRLMYEYSAPYQTFLQHIKAGTSKMSITHTVLFQFKDNVDQKEITRTCDDFLQLKDLCIHHTSKKPYITSLQGGKDNSPEGMQNGITHGFVATFESAEDRDYYVKTDPAHQAFIAQPKGQISIDEENTETKTITTPYVPNTNQRSHGPVPAEHLARLPNAPISFQLMNGTSPGLGFSGSQTDAGLRQLTIHTLDHTHQDTVTSAFARILDTDIAEVTYAQIIDGLPLGEVGFESRGGIPHQDHPINHCHDELCAGILDKAREFRRRFDPLVLEFDSRLLFAYQAASLGSRSFNTRLIEIIAIAVHQIVVILFSLEDGLHKNDGVIEWAPPKSDKFWWAHCPDGPEPTMFFHPWYLSHPRYPNRVANMVGYWAESRILGGVVLFDRSSVDQDAVYIHPDREDFLTGEEPGHNPLPILPDETNDFRVDPEESPEETGIYRDIWDRSELREDAYDQRLRDVWNKVDYLTHSDKGDAGDRALERRNRIFYAYSDDEA